MAITTASQSQIGQETAKNSQIVTTSVKLVNSGLSGGPLITSIIVTDSEYNILDDTAVGTSNSFIKIIGSGFVAGVNVFIGGTQVPAANITFTSSAEIRVALPVLTSGTNTVSLFNSSGSGVIYLSGILASGFPTVTTSSYSVESFTVSTQLLATGDGTLSYSLKSGSSLPSGLTLSSTGLISGTAVQNSTTIFTVLVDDLQGQTIQQDITLVINGLDPYYQYTSLLLQADNTSNNSTNETIIDSSNNSYTVTNSETIQGTVNPFGTGTWSNSFDGTTDYLTTPDTNAFGYSTGDFTIEFWMYLNSTAADQTVVSNLSSGSGVQPHIYFTTVGNTLKYYTNSVDRITSSALSISTWYHVAICRSSGSTKMFINGTQAGSTYTDANNYGSSAPLGIGTYWNAGSPVTTSTFNGYISNVRIIKGTALYTSTFTPSTTPLTTVANTQLLTCQSNNIKDTSNNALTLTAAGDVTVERFNPFGVNTVSYEVSANTFAGSTHFNGSTNYLTVAANTGLNLSADFTVECWAYATTTTNSPDQVFNYGNFRFMMYHVDTTWTVEIGSGSSNYFSLQGTASLNNWHHFAITRNANTYTFWINGVSAATATNSNPPGLSGATLSIGRSQGTSNQWFTGFISNFRILKGTALYTSNFTPSTTPLTTVANTQLLTCQSSQSVVTDESTNKFTITAAGTPRATTKTPFTLTDTSTANTTYGGSIYFNGSSYLSLGGVSGLALGAGDFTVECWVYHTSFGASQVVYEGRPSNTNGPYLTISTNSNSFVVTVNNSNIIGATPSVIVNRWYHLAVVKNSGTITAYLNGVSVGSAADSTTFTTGSAAPYIGTNAFGVGSGGIYAFRGYISNLRVVKGTAVYTGAFTPPTTPAQPITNTALLLSGVNSGIYDATLKNSIKTVSGDTKVRTNVTKYGTGSMYFGGNQNYLIIPHTKDVDLSSNDFTIETWVYWNSYVAGSAILYKGGAVAYGSYLIYVGDAASGTEVDFYTSVSGSAWSVSQLNFTINPTLGVWHHLAVTRSGNVYRTFFNGTLANSVTQAGNLVSSTSHPLWVGKYNAGNTFDGYMDDLRITKGYARYTANFTPPNAALKNR